MNDDRLANAVSRYQTKHESDYPTALRAVFAHAALAMTQHMPKELLPGLFASASGLPILTSAARSGRLDDGVTSVDGSATSLTRSPRFTHNVSAGSAHILDAARHTAARPGTARYTAVMRKLRSIRSTRGNQTVTGVLNPAEADQLGLRWVGEDFRVAHS